MQSTTATWVGVDVGAQELVVHLRPTATHFTVANTPAGIRQLLHQLSPVAPRCIVLEATGGYERPAVYALSDAGLPVAVVNPRQTRQFAGVLGRLEKTDPIDAAMLAEYAERIQPPVRPQPDPVTRTLQALVTRRRQLVNMRTAERNRRHQASAAQQGGIDRHLAYLQQEIGHLDTEIAQTISAHPGLHQRSQYLRTAKGAGQVLIATLLAFVPELGTLTRRQIAKLIGVAPLPHDSGQHRGHRRCFGGRGMVRAVLYMAMGSAMQYNPTIRALYTRLIAKGKLPKVALTACMRKFLVRLNAMARDQQSWRDETTTP